MIYFYYFFTVSSEKWKKNDKYGEIEKFYVTCTQKKH